MSNPSRSLGLCAGRPFLETQCEQAPRLRAISCVPQIGASELDPIDVTCGVCGRCLFTNLADYVVHVPQQPHIAYEIHTNVEPNTQATHANEPDATRIECAGRCQPGLWLIDAGSGWVHHVLGRRFAVACGPPRGARMMQLCKARRAGTRLAAVGAGAAGDPVLDQDDHFMAAILKSRSSEDV